MDNFLFCACRHRCSLFKPEIVGPSGKAPSAAAVSSSRCLPSRAVSFCSKHSHCASAWPLWRFSSVLPAAAAVYGVRPLVAQTLQVCSHYCLVLPVIIITSWGVEVGGSLRLCVQGLCCLLPGVAAASFSHLRQLFGRLWVSWCATSASLVQDSSHGPYFLTGSVLVCISMEKCNYIFLSCFGIILFLTLLLFFIYRFM